jgi:hypothetical protein
MDNKRITFTVDSKLLTEAAFPVLQVETILAHLTISELEGLIKLVSDRLIQPSKGWRSHKLIHPSDEGSVVGSFAYGSDDDFITVYEGVAVNSSVMERMSQEGLIDKSVVAFSHTENYWPPK